ncbi:DUF2484 family protein [Brevirhabdus sp.]|uniref:DUF2484 family protein n=1 Tax=Brevirhabdus sp. TaxID=2004514 RepID=UPI0040592B35
MNWSLALVFLWAIAANVTGMFPSRHNHWPAAYVLIAVGIPLLGFVTYQNGPWVGLIAMMAGGSILRWPLYYLWRHLRGRTARRIPPKEPNA